MFYSDAQWEISNPLYFSDDSTPPIPNITVDNFGAGGADLIDDNSFVTLNDPTFFREESSDPTNLNTFVGIPNTRSYDSTTDIETTTGDHYFYSQLNLDTRIPQYLVENPASLETYFRDFVPAACGISTPYVGNDPATHLVTASNAAGNRQPFVFAGSELDYIVSQNRTNPFHGPYTALTSTSSEWPRSYNHIYSVARNVRRRATSAIRGTFDYLDIVLNIRMPENPKEYAHSYTRVNFDKVVFIMYFKYIAESHEMIVSVQQYYRYSDDSTPNAPALWRRYQLNFSRRISLDNYMIAENKSDYLRLYVRQSLKELSPSESVILTSADTFSTNGSFSDTSLFEETSTLQLNSVNVMEGTELPEDVGFYLPYTFSIFGRTGDMVSQEGEIIEMSRHHPDPKHYYYPLYDTEAANKLQYPFVIPGHSGNAWEYVNKVASTLPYRKIIE